MSYDVYLEADLGGREPVQLDVLGGGWNYTSNVYPLWRKAMPESDGLAGMHGMEAGRAAAILRAGIVAMEADPEPYRAMNPENGWGDFDRQLVRLRELLAAFEQAPQATVRVDR